MVKIPEPSFSRAQHDAEAPNTRRSGAHEGRPADGATGHSSMASNADNEPSSRRAMFEDVPFVDLQVMLRVICEAGSDILESTHIYVTALAKSKFRPAVAERVSLSCWELLSNALSYGSIRRPVVLELCDLKNFIELRVTNDSIAARCQMLEQRIEQLKRDAKGTYLQEMRRSVSGGLPRATLGLARVAHEGKMDLSCTVGQGRVLVIARCSV